MFLCFIIDLYYPAFTIILCSSELSCISKYFYLIIFYCVFHYDPLLPRCIKDGDYKCQALVNAMSHAHIPFSAELETLITEALGTGHPRVAEIKERLHLVELQK